MGMYIGEFRIRALMPCIITTYEDITEHHTENHSFPRFHRPLLPTRTKAHT